MEKKQSKWMWYKDDFELFHSHKLHARRNERGVIYPVHWCIPAVYNNVRFRKIGTLEKPETICVKINGIGHVCINGELFPADKPIVVAAGNYCITVSVNNLYGLPCAFIEGDTIVSDETWNVSRGTGKCGWGIWVKSACRDDYKDKDVTPETFAFAYKKIDPVSVTNYENGLLFDYGKETFATLCFKKLTKDVMVSYGETDIEAVDTDHSYIIEEFLSENEGIASYAKAFRYLYIPNVTEEDIELEVQYEYLPVEQKSSFQSDSDLLNGIWEVAAYTMELNSREFYLDGIKRDRWVWSGDAYQSYFVNRYLCFDEDIAVRTIRELGGKDAIVQHINNITDYTFYWILSIYDHYEMSGDKKFLEDMFPRMTEFMEYAISRLDDKGFVNRCGNDWIFIDWADFDKEGAMCAEQILLRRSLETYIKCARLLGENADTYQKMLDDLANKIEKYFWCEEKGAYIDTFESGKKNVTRHANILALLFGYGTEAQRESIVQNVILNDEIPQISTPYFKFYELESMCTIGKYEYVLEQIKDYWGAMVKIGATTFWEEFTPNVDWKDQLGMYELKYDKSLCHAWGSSPIYLLGRYFLGVRPTSAGYDTFVVEPHLDGINEVNSVLPIKSGSVFIQKANGKITVKADKDGGMLIHNGKKYPLYKDVEVTVDCDSYWTQSKDNIWVAAHRGWCSKYPENTMEAIKAAVEIGVDQIETDVRVTKDGELVLFHDPTVDRTTNGTGKVIDYTLEELRALDAGSHKGEEFEGYKVPTFIEFMDYMKTLPKITIDIELKEYPVDGHEAIAYDVCDRVLKIVDEYGFTDRVVINSFSNKLNEYVHEKYGNKYRQHVFYPMHQLVGKATIDPYSYAYCCCVLGDKAIGTVISEQAACDYLTNHGVEPWGGAGIKDEATVDLAIERGVTLITCNNPDVVIELLRQKGRRI